MLWTDNLTVETGVEKVDMDGWLCVGNTLTRNAGRLDSQPCAAQTVSPHQPVCAFHDLYRGFELTVTPTIFITVLSSQ